MNKILIQENNPPHQPPWLLHLPGQMIGANSLEDAIQFCKNNNLGYEIEITTKEYVWI